MGKWVLKIELDGEWEECRFATRKEALSAFISLMVDYALLIKRAVLVCDELAAQTLALVEENRATGYVN